VQGGALIGQHIYFSLQSIILHGELLCRLNAVFHQL
jgi:hypothetical protein